MTPVEQLCSRLELDDIETRKPLNQPYDLNQYVTAFEVLIRGLVDTREQREAAARAYPNCNHRGSGQRLTRQILGSLDRNEDDRDLTSGQSIGCCSNPIQLLSCGCRTESIPFLDTEGFVAIFRLSGSIKVLCPNALWRSD